MTIASQNKIRALVVDDEPLARRLIMANLDNFPQVEVVGQCSSGRQAIEQIESLKPDLMFLDIQMPVIGGFDVIKSVDSKLLPKIIFVTAFDEYAIDAFDANAIDYVLKPINEKRFASALLRAIASLSNDNNGNNDKQYISDSLVAIADRVKQKNKTHNAIVEQESNEKKISIKDGSNVMIVNQSDIDWIDAAGDYMCIHIAGDIHVMRSTMHDLLSKLDGIMFKRIHRSTVVNLNKISKIQKYKKGEFLLHLKCDKTLKVSRHYKQEIKSFIESQS